MTATPPTTQPPCVCGACTHPVPSSSQGHTPCIVNPNIAQPSFKGVLPLCVNKILLEKKKMRERESEREKEREIKQKTKKQQQKTNKSKRKQKKQQKKDINVLFYVCSQQGDIRHTQNKKQQQQQTKIKVYSCIITCFKVDSQTKSTNMKNQLHIQTKIYF